MISHYSELLRTVMSGCSSVHWELRLFLLLRLLASPAPNRRCCAVWTAHILVLYISAACCVHCVAKQNVFCFTEGLH